MSIINVMASKLVIAVSQLVYFPANRDPILITGLLQTVTLIFVIVFKYVISSVNVRLKLLKPMPKGLQREFSPSQTMDLLNLTETEGPLIEANSSESESHLGGNVNYFDVMEIIQLSVAPVGIIGNLTVIVVFLNHKKLRRKIPKRFIINQVRILLSFLVFIPVIACNVCRNLLASCK